VDHRSRRINGILFDNFRVDSDLVGLRQRR
jgi:hypothetical protein